MLINPEAAAIYLKPGPTDMRQHINGLSALAQQGMGRNVFDGSLFLFCSRDRKRLKLLYWQRNGFCLWTKRLEQDKFPWPHNDQAALAITPQELQMLLAGIDFFHAHQELNYSRAA